jgi:hypothetical protein
MDAVCGSTGQVHAPRRWHLLPDPDGRFEVIYRIDLQTLSQFGKTIGLTGPTKIFVRQRTDWCEADSVLRGGASIAKLEEAAL